MSSENQRSPMNVHGDSGLALTTDPKPRLRWTLELHTRFVDAVTQLGGPDRATPKTIMRVMGVKGLTLFHLKSHLQKFRLGKLPRNGFPDHPIKHELRRNAESLANVVGQDPNDNSHMAELINMQMELQRRLHEQLERHLQLKMEAQGKYTHRMLEQAYPTPVGENMARFFESTVPYFQDLDIWGGDQLDFEEPMDTFPPIDDDIWLETTESGSCGDGRNSHFLWSEGLQLRVLEMAAESGGSHGERIVDLL